MPTTLAFKPLIDLPEWRPIANAPARLRSRFAVGRGPAEQHRPGRVRVSAHEQRAPVSYDVEDDDWLPLASPALGGTFGAGAGAVMMPALGPRGVLAGGNTTSSIVSEHRSACGGRAEPTRQQGQLERLQDPHHRQ